MVRISGLASGMDIDELVTSMMQAERTKVDTVTQKKQYAEWQRDDYREVNTALSELDTLIRDGVGKQASFIKKTVSVSNPDAVSVKNVNSTSDFAGTVTVKNLATAATMVSTGKTEISDATKTLKDLGITVPQTISILAINKDGKYDVDTNDGNKEKPYTLELKADDTLNSVIQKINADSGVTVFFDPTSQKFSITAKNTGDISDKPEITLESTANKDGETSFFSALKMNENNDLAVKGKAGTAGTNATVTYNGLEITRPSNTFQINGAEITIKQKTTDPVTFSSKADVDAILDTVTQFVNKYNELIKKVSDKVDEKKYRNYAPLTTAQKKELSEDEVKLWNEKAKSGTLKSDSTLKSLLTTMRSSLYSSVSGITGKNSLSEIGITTTSNYLEGGKLTIDEDKLRAAISEDPNSIYKLFMSGSNDSKTTSEQGLARRLRSDLSSAMKAITEKAGKASSVNTTFTIGKLLNSYDKKIETMEDKLTALETRYYKQFSAMESYINKANSQSTSLSSYFS